MVEYVELGSSDTARMVRLERLDPRPVPPLDSTEKAILVFPVALSIIVDRKLSPPRGTEAD